MEDSESERIMLPDKNSVDHMHGWNLIKRDVCRLNLPYKAVPQQLPHSASHFQTERKLTLFTLPAAPLNHPPSSRLSLRLLLTHGGSTPPPSYSIKSYHDTWGSPTTLSRGQHDLGHRAPGAAELPCTGSRYLGMQVRELLGSV
jgi:hypothetical protein